MSERESRTERSYCRICHNVNLLTSIREVDPLTGMARYSGIPVSVHPLPVASV